MTYKKSVTLISVLENNYNTMRFHWWMSKQNGGREKKKAYAFSSVCAFVGLQWHYRGNAVVKAVSDYKCPFLLLADAGKRH